MEEFELDTNVFNQNMQAEQDAKLAVHFYKRPVKDEGRSVIEGRPIFIELDYIKIIAPGNSTNIIDRPVDDTDKKRFKSKYEAWLRGESEVLSGTPLEEWPLINRSLVEELKFYNIKTVEDIVNCPDNLAASVHGFFVIKQQAEKFLEVSKVLGGDVLKKFEELEAKNSELAAKIKELEQKTLTPSVKKAV